MILILTSKGSSEDQADPGSGSWLKMRLVLRVQDQVQSSLWSCWRSQSIWLIQLSDWSLCDPVCLNWVQHWPDVGAIDTMQERESVGDRLQA